MKKANHIRSFYLLAAGLTILSGSLALADEKPDQIACDNARKEETTLLQKQAADAASGPIAMTSDQIRKALINDLNTLGCLPFERDLAISGSQVQTTQASDDLPSSDNLF